MTEKQALLDDFKDAISIQIESINSFNPAQPAALHLFPCDLLPLPHKSLAIPQAPSRLSVNGSDFYCAKKIEHCWGSAQNSPLHIWNRSITALFPSSEPRLPWDYLLLCSWFLSSPASLAFPFCPAQFYSLSSPSLRLKICAQFLPHLNKPPCNPSPPTSLLLSIFLPHHQISGKKSSSSSLLPLPCHSHTDPLKFGSQHIPFYWWCDEDSDTQTKVRKTLGFRQGLR